MELTWPIPRSVYASLPGKTGQGRSAKTVGFDLIFPNPSNPYDDGEFAECIEGNMDNVFHG
jgi:CHASE2 domain-containing sensor protein